MRFFFLSFSYYCQPERPRLRFGWNSSIYVFSHKSSLVYYHIWWYLLRQAMQNVLVHHLPRYYQAERLSFIASTALVTWNRCRKLVLMQIWQSFWLPLINPVQLEQSTLSTQVRRAVDKSFFFAFNAKSSELSEVIFRKFFWFSNPRIVNRWFSLIAAGTWNAFIEFPLRFEVPVSKSHQDFFLLNNSGDYSLILYQLHGRDPVHRSFVNFL